MIDWILDNVLGELVSFIVGGLLSWLISNRKHVVTSVRAFVNGQTEFRVSLSYLFRIKVDNKYLLVKGKRIEQYQPVGGVYKYHSSFEDMFNSLELRHENTETFYEKNDLRIYVKGKSLDKLVKWFESGKNRECTVQREFVEELIEPGIIAKEIMEEVDFEFLRRINNGVHYSTHFKCKELLIYDIYDVILSEEAETALKSGIQQNSNAILVTFEDIERECVNIAGQSRKIGAHAKLIR